jgi:hypothetical protein
MQMKVNNQKKKNKKKTTQQDIDIDIDAIENVNNEGGNCVDMMVCVCCLFIYLLFYYI